MSRGVTAKQAPQHVVCETAVPIWHKPATLAFWVYHSIQSLMATVEKYQWRHDCNIAFRSRGLAVEQAHINGICAATVQISHRPATLASWVNHSSQSLVATELKYLWAQSYQIAFMSKGGVAEPANILVVFSIAVSIRHRPETLAS